MTANNLVISLKIKVSQTIRAEQKNYIPNVFCWIVQAFVLVFMLMVKFMNNKSTPLSKYIEGSFFNLILSMSLWNNGKSIDNWQGLSNVERLLTWCCKPISHRVLPTTCPVCCRKRGVNKHWGNEDLKECSHQKKFLCCFVDVCFMTELPHYWLVVRNICRYENCTTWKAFIL